MNDYDQEWQDRYVSLDHVTAEEPPWFVPGILAEGFNVFASPSGRGKTAFAARLARSLIPGGEVFMKTAPLVQGKVIYLPAEESPKSLKFKAEWHDPPPPPGYTVWRLLVREDAASITLDNPHEMDHLLYDATSMDAVAVFIDPFSNFHDGDENDRKVIRRLVRPLYVWSHAKPGRAVVVVHHTKKLDEDRPLTWDDVRGSGALINAADGALLFQAPEGNLISIDTKFRNHKAGQLTWSLPTFGG